MNHLSATVVAKASRFRVRRARPQSLGSKIVLPALAAILATTLASAPVGAAQQLDARREPEVSGPLTLAGKRCVPDTIYHEGERVATSVACLYVYTYSSLAELDIGRDYGVLWLQATVDGVGDWCATTFEAATMLSQEGRIEAIAPRGSTRASTPRPETVELTLEAGGLTWSEGTLSQDYVVNPRGVSSRQTSKDNSDGMSLKWQGMSGAKHALVGGAEFSWNALGDFPTKILFGITSYGFMKTPDCPG